MISISGKKRSILYFLSAWSVFLLFSLSLLAIRYNATVHSITNNTRLVQQNDLDDAARNIQSVINEISSDILYLSKSKIIQNYIINGNRENIIQDWIIFIEENPYIDTIRLIGTDGKEKICIEYNNGFPTSVPDDILGNLSSDQEIEQILELKPDEIYLSSFHINTEFEPEHPVKNKTAKIATLIIDKKGMSYGTLMFTYHPEKIITGISSSLFLLDANGDYLIHPLADSVWINPKELEAPFSSTYPIVWDSIKTSNAGILNMNGFEYLYSTIQQDLYYIQKKPGSRNSSIKTGLKLISVLPNRDIVSQVDNTKHSFSILFFIITIFTLLIAALFTWINQSRENAVAMLQTKANELEANNNTKNKLFSIIAHDLRNPIGGIKNVLELLVDKSLNIDEQKSKELTVELLKSADMTYNLLENLLLWAKNQKNEIRVDFKIFALKDVIDENVRFVAPMARKKEIELISQVKGNCKVYADPDLTTTVIRNLLTNALKFTQPGGSVTIKAKKIKKHIRTSIIDTGVGINQEDIDSIFALNLKSTYGTAKEKGSGLGLDICKHFVELNKGNIWANSKKDQGSEFHFTIPVP